MVKWKLFSRFRSKEEEKPGYEESTQVETEETLQTETEQEPEEPTAVEYHETLYSEDTPYKKGKKNQKKRGTIRRTIWRDIRGVEENVDKLHLSRARKPVTELDKKIDRITSTIGVYESETYRKPSNVIYVVNRPQPGQVRGDWAVRGHGKIYSQHRTKEKAVKAARKIAKEKNATVMVQNTDGTFSEGFKPI